MVGLVNPFQRYIVMIMGGVEMRPSTIHIMEIGAFTAPILQRHDVMQNIKVEIVCVHARKILLPEIDHAVGHGR